MTYFANVHIKRRISSVMLVLWLFALGAGWANACVLQERGEHQHADQHADQHANLIDATTAHGGMHTLAAGHAGLQGDHGVNSVPGKAPCLKVCHDASQSLVKGASGIDMPDLTLSLPNAMAWPVSVLGLSAPLTAHVARPQRVALPLRTRYVRLAL